MSTQFPSSPNDSCWQVAHQYRLWPGFLVYQAFSACGARFRPNGSNANRSSNIV
jgi:hypothetical protein